MFKKRERKTKRNELNNDQSPEETKSNPSDRTTTNTHIQQSLKDFLNKKRRPTSNTIGQFSTATTTSKNKPNAHEETFFKSSFELKNTNTATREIEIDTDYQKDSQAIRERNAQISKELLEGKIGDNIYTGKNTTIIYAEKSERDLSRYKVTGSLGPMRAPKNLRVNCRIDYAHGICKDYKETGYCGFGDSCVFLHDRGDYKTGCELEEDWNREQRRKEKEKMRRIAKGNNNDNEEDSHSGRDSDSDGDKDKKDDNVLCGICKEEMIEPIATNCSHYFCQSCAFKFYEKSHNCALCDRPTQGLFHNASKIIDHIKKNKQKREAEINASKVPMKKQLNSNAHDELHIDNEDNDGFGYLDNRHYDVSDLLNDEDNDKSKSNNAQVHFVKDKKNKKNKAKMQNDWLYLSDYRSYD